MVIRIKNLRLRAIIGTEEWERKNKQEVVVNIILNYDGTKAASSDRIEDAINYQKIIKRVIELVESSSFNLLESLAKALLDVIMEDKRIVHTKLEIDKPLAQRFADSVSVELSRDRKYTP